MLGESNRLSGRSLPVDTELRTRSEERFEPFEPFVSKSKRKAGPVEAVIAFTPTEPASSTPEPVLFAEPEREIALADRDEAEIFLDETPEELEPVVADAFDEPEALTEAEPESQVPAPSLSLVDDEPEVRLSEPEPEPAAAPLAFAFSSHAGTVNTNNSDNNALDAAADRPVRPESRWQAVPTRDASASPFDGSLNDMVEELHRKAREDVGNHR